MFSTMMIDPLAILPIPMARPPMDITVRLTPNRCIRTRDIRIDRGMVSEAIRELLRFHMKNIMTRTIKKAPSRMETSTWLIDLMIKTDWS